MKKDLHFLKVAILSKSKTGAITRSSRFVVKSVLRLIKGRVLEQIVEYGAGDGVVTLELLKHLSPSGRLLAIEIDPEFLKILRKIKDPRLFVADGSIEDVSKNLAKYDFNKVDLVLSSIPFSYLSKPEREEVCSITEKSLRPEGMFIVFHQYSTLMVKPLKKFFKRVDVHFEPRNFLPCFIISAVL